MALGAALIDNIFGDLLGTLFGTDKFRQLFDQSESNFLQYSTSPTDRRQWFGQFDNSSPTYFFLLKVGTRVVQIPFGLNPQRDSWTEPHALSTHYTQGGGKLNQSEGMISKEITLQGRVGLYPNQGTRNPLPTTGIGSGLEGFKFLQNVIRRYCFLKRYGDLKGTIQLIYVDRLRQESWVVEPKSFTSEKATEINFDTQYTIVLETLYPYDGQDAKSLAEQLLDAIPFYRQFDVIAQRLSEAVDQLNVSVGKISAIVNGFTSQAFQPLMQLANSYADLKAGRLPNLSSFKRDSVKNLNFQLRQTATALEAAGQPGLAATVTNAQKRTRDTLLNDNLYDTQPQTKSTSTTKLQTDQLANFQNFQGGNVSASEAIAAGASVSQPDAGKMLGGTATSPAALPGSATAAAQAAANIHSFQTVSTVGSSFLDPNGNFQVAFPTVKTVDPATLTPPSTQDLASQILWASAQNQAVRNIDPANADYRTATISTNDDISSLAYRLLGDHARWPELAMLNNLQYPYVADAAYIAANNLKNVLPYGGTLLYNIPKQSSAIRTRVWRNETDASLSLSAFERSLGSDILVDAGDIVYTANDISLTYGSQNLSQFIQFRLVTRKGDYRRSIGLGFSNYIGLSVGVTQEVVRAEANSLFSDDDRILAVDVPSVQIQEGQVFALIVVTVKDQQDPIIRLANVS